MRAISILPHLISCTLLIASGTALAQRANQESYSFTQAFVSCVKENRNEQDAQYNSGAASTGAIGGSLSNGQPLSADRRYWNYMDCITPGTSGLSRQPLPVGVLCSATQQLPSGTEGKTFLSNGATWTCLSGTWTITEGSNNPPSRLDCSGKSFSQDSCSFNVGSMKHGQNLVVRTTPSNLSGTYGNAVASCNNGEITLSKIYCGAKSCRSGEYVTWFEQEENSLHRCRGKINSLGDAEVENVIKFYSTINEALRRSNVLQGNAQYECRGDTWVYISGNCKKKSEDEMTCQARSNALGKSEYYCL